MKDIQFTKQGKTYVAEFEVNADFNLHIEKSQSGYLYMQQRSTSGKWDSVRNFQATDSDYIVDYDFTALVYPKQIRLVSKYAPTMCVLTSDGDVIEIKSQSKEVEITQNGEMSVTPDDGFAYLSSVNVKTNVPQQGGGESGGGSSSESELDSQMTYFDVREGQGDRAAQTLLMMSAEIISGTMAGIPAAGLPVKLISASDSIVKYIGVNLDRTVYTVMDGITQSTTIKDMLLDNLTEEQLNSVRKVTKEEFYNLES